MSVVHGPMTPPLEEPEDCVECGFQLYPHTMRSDPKPTMLCNRCDHCEVCDDVLDTVQASYDRERFVVQACESCRDAFGFTTA